MCDSSQITKNSLTDKQILRKIAKKKKNLQKYLKKTKERRINWLLH